MKFVSWNVNGLRAAISKGFLAFFQEVDADIFCIQETKMKEEQLDIVIDGYYKFFNSAEKNGYSGTAIFSKINPISVSYGIGMLEHDNEGRVITLEFSDFYLVTVYTPNSKRELERLEYRCKWEDDFRSYLQQLEQSKPVIVCGDLNVAHQEMDIKNPKSNVNNAGFTIQERTKMTELLTSGWIDTYRYLHPDTVDAYTWWSYMRDARNKNIGWRLDYFLVSNCLKESIIEATIYASILGSDHCPVGLELQ